MGSLGLWPWFRDCRWLCGDRGCLLLLLLLALRFRHARTHRLSNHGVELTSRVVVGLLYPHLGLRRRWSLTVRHFACLGLITEHFGRFSSRSGNARLCANDKQAGRRALRQVSPTPHRQARRIGTVPSRRRAVQVLWEALRKRKLQNPSRFHAGGRLVPVETSTDFSVYVPISLVSLPQTADVPIMGPDQTSFFVV